MTQTRRPVATGMHHQFKKGVFLSYRSTNTFHVGSIEHLQIFEDDIVEFDGYTLRIGSDEYSAPSLRGAVKSEWLVPEGDVTTVYQPRPAGVMMAPADTAKSKQAHAVTHAAMSNDERIVGSRQNVRQAAARGTAPRQVSGGAVSAPGVITVDQGIEIGKVNVPAKGQPKELTRSNAHIAKEMALKGADAGNRATMNMDSDALRRMAEAEANTAGMTAEELEIWEAKQERRRLAAMQAEASREARRANFEEEGGLPIAEHDKAQAQAQMRDISTKKGTYQGAGAVSFDEGNPEETAQALHAMEQSGTPVPMTAQVGTVSGGPAMESRIVRTSVGVDWELGRPLHVRMRDAMERFGWSKDILLAIAEVEEDDVARFLFNQAGVEAPKPAKKAPAKKDPAKKSEASVAPDHVDEEEFEEDPEVAAALDAELGDASGELAEGEIVTSSGIAWNTASPPHWASRVKKAVSEFGGDIEDLLSIAEVEIPAVAKRIKEHVEKLQAEE